MERRENSQGFTLIELMIVVVIIGILAAIAVPNYLAMSRRAQESSVKHNMHTVQLIMEDFSVLTDGNYPDDATSTTPDGRTLSALCPNGDYPVNPFTDAPSVVQFDALPTAGNPGELGFSTATPSSYVLRGNGPTGDTLRVSLTTGQ